MSCQVKSCVFVRNKSIVKTFLTSNCRFWLKYESSNYNIAFSSEKVILSESGEYAQIKHCLQVKTVLNKICWWILMWEDNRGWTFSLEEELWIMGLYFGQRCLDSHSDGTHSQQRINWWASDAMLNFSKIYSHEETNPSTSWMTSGLVNPQQIFIFGSTIALKLKVNFTFQRSCTMPENTPNCNSALTVGSVAEKAISAKKWYYTLDLVLLPVMNFYG